jgi:hypothetical protein
MFLETGSVLRKKGSGRPTKRTPENIEQFEQIIVDTPNKSIRRLIQENQNFNVLKITNLTFKIDI